MMTGALRAQKEHQDERRASKFEAWLWQNELKYVIK